MGDTVISVERLSKRYQIGALQAQGTSLRQTLEETLKAPLSRLGRAVRTGRVDTTKAIWALQDVSFEVTRGEVVGIIGRNGAGKSTLLKILSRITEPTMGRAVLDGRVGSLLEVGTGFHPELTGRENMYLNGAILGMKRQEIARKFDEIVDFSGIEQFIDTPVKHYSSGMQVRLAFAVAAHLDPEILIIDEVLAVGDLAFQEKCLGKIGEVTGSGRSVLFVSHNMAAVASLCTRGILIEAGRIVLDSTPQAAIAEYIRESFGNQNTGVIRSDVKRSGTGAFRFTRFHIETPDGRELSAIQSGDDIVFAFEYESNLPSLSQVSVGIGLQSEFRQTLFVLYNDYTNQVFPTISSRGVFKCKIEKFPLAPGRYAVEPRGLVSGVEADWPRDESSLA